MNLPGFSAEKSLYKTDKLYCADDVNRVADTIRPAWGIDCYPMCVIFARARCRKICPPHSIDCIPICNLIAERRCRSQCQGSISF